MMGEGAYKETLPGLPSLRKHKKTYKNLAPLWGSIKLSSSTTRVGTKEITRPFWAGITRKAQCKSQEFRYRGSFLGGKRHAIVCSQWASCIPRAKGVIREALSVASVFVDAYACGLAIWGILSCSPRSPRWHCFMQGQACAASYHIYTRYLQMLTVHLGTPPYRQSSLFLSPKACAAAPTKQAFGKVGTQMKVSALSSIWVAYNGGFFIWNSPWHLNCDSGDCFCFWFGFI